MGRKLKICKSCNELKPDYGGLCGKCYMREYRKIDKGKKSSHDAYLKYRNTPKGKKYYEGCRKQNLKNSKKYNIKLKANALKIIGVKCICCGLDIFSLLSVDHIIPISKLNVKRLGSVNIYKEILNNPKIAKKKFQTMCTGCNVSKGYSEKCRLDHSIKTVNDALKLTLY